MYSQVPPPAITLDFSSSVEGNCEPRNETEEEVRSGNSSISSNSATKASRFSDEKWKKFLELKERRQELCRSESDQGTRSRGCRRRQGNVSSQMEKKRKREILKNNNEAWKEVCSNLDASAHLVQQSIAKDKPKSKLEEQLDEALRDGKFSEAQAISDAMSQQELSVKIVGAIEMREYKKKKQMDDELRKAKKRKKLKWSFDQKERWESKGNM